MIAIITLFIVLLINMGRADEEIRQDKLYLFRR